MSCVKVTDTIKEYASNFPGETPETIANLLGIWDSQNPQRAGEMPTVSELNSFMNNLRFPRLISPTIVRRSTKWTRDEVARDTESLYLFSDNTDRDSGKTLIDPTSEYAKKYGENLHYPTVTQAVIRGLDHAMPISTQRWYHEGAKGKSGRWNDEDFAEFKKVIDAEIYDIVRKWSTRKYKRVIIGEGSFFNTSISDISMERTPRLYQYLKAKLAQIGIESIGSVNRFSQQSAETSTKKATTAPINIYYGTGENAHLSNFAVRPFIVTSTGVDPIAPIEGNFKTVEGAFQAQKLAYSSMPEQEQEAIRKQLENASGSKARMIGRSIKGLDTRKWDELSSSLMKNLILASFEQNPQALQQLLATGNATLTHNQAKDKYKVVFPRILMEVREELRSSDASQMLDEALLPNKNIKEATKETTKEEPDMSSFDREVIPVASLSEQKAVDLVFDPRIRRDRVTLISRLFSNEIDEALKEKQDKINTRMMEEELTEDQRKDLRKELYSLNRFQVIKSLTPGGIFDRVKKIFEDYNNSTEEDRIQAELNKINTSELELLNEGVITREEMFSEEEKLEAAKKKATYKYQEYQKIIEHFRALAEEASGLLLMTEGIRVDPNYVAPDIANLNEVDPEGNSEMDNQADGYNKEESIKDGWMTNFRQVSSHESLSQAVRKVIMEIPSLDYEGMIDEDDLGNIRYLDANFVHATLIDKLRNMITSEDMVPLLEDLAKQKPWVEQILEIVQNDDTLFSQFYQDFRKDFVQYWIQKKIKNPDGTFKIETISINKPEGIYYLLDSWRDNYESGTILDEDSIYEKDGSINRGNATKGLKIYEDLNNKFNNKTTQERLELLEDEKIWGDIIKMLNMIGIDPNPSVLRVALTNIKEAPGVIYTDPIQLLLPNFQIIFSGIRKGEVQSEVAEDGTIKRGDLINTFGTAYNNIALMLAEVTEDAIESSVRENEKSYYSHVTPSYLGKLIKQLKNVRGDKEKFEQFIQTEYKQFEWFYKDGRWRSDWIEKLATNSSYRDILQHKVLLNHDKIEYTDWDELDYTIILLNEYLSDPKEKTAWYHVPNLSDAPSAEFIKFVRYTSGSEIDELTGEKLSFQDIILNKMIDIVNQEYDRIQLVRERDDIFTEGGDIALIDNFDIKRDKKGNITSLGGAEFKFIPELNNYRTENGKLFLDEFARLREKGSSSEFREFIKKTLSDIMESGFEATYEEWDNIGLFEELPNGKYKNLPSKFEGQSKANKRVVTALKEAQKYLGELFTEDMVNLLNKLKNNKVINDRQANEILDQVKELLNFKEIGGEISTVELNNIVKNLTIKNNTKEALREYYYNSKFATSQIIEMTTTDLAFYKNLEDFQKRYKEIHAPSLRLNTMAKFHGETIGRTWERTIYLFDDVIISSVIDDIKEVLNSRVDRGEMTTIERDYILSQFKEVNVADAQAYRSISSYRAMLGMMGQWTDDMETAYNHLKDPNGQWTLEDFNIIWQTKKPYVYTQINNDSGVEGHSGIKTPVQHKNSEFLLLALHEAICGPLGKSGKLRAINDFMEKYQIDVIQFESTTKVSKQGVIDINNVTSYEDTMRALEEATGIASGNENPNVVHKVSYEDYGIQTATPEHAIDAVQLIGTQIRKLITADISNDTKITIDGRTFTKTEWLNLYNRIITENILQSFIEVDEIFKDPKKVEEVLLEEVRGNSRYGIDMVRACTLNDKGEFNIPLYDPVQSQRVQELLTSVIKNRITKQKIRGGALIQVSAYGLTDQLKIVFEGKREKKRIKYIECYMPAYSKEFYEPLMGEDGQLDVTKLPDDLRKLIGYRVPTEDKYSMAPLYIKGFLPQQNGSAIMLPAEITTLSGSDFDVDKLYIMLPEFKVVNNYNIKQAWTNFYNDPGNSDISDEIERNLDLALEDYNDRHPDDNLDIDDYLEFLHDQGVKKYQLSKDAQDRFSTWFKTRKSKYLLNRKIKKVKYDYNKLPQEQSPEARNNAIIDMMWGVLTNPDTASKILNPGGFDKQKRAARIVTILDSTSEKELREELSKKFKISKGESIYSYLLKLPLFTKKKNEDGTPKLSLDSLASRVKKILDPLSPRTQVIIHQQNMTGNKMIGIYANHNASHALLQHISIFITGRASFTYAGVEMTRLNKIKNKKGDYISRNNANYLAASVDNVKDNTLYATNQNTFTGDTTMLLSRLGYTPTEIAILMRQPIVMQMTKEYFRNSKEGKSKESIMDKVISKTAEYAGMYNDLSYKKIKGNKFELNTLMRDIQLYKDVSTMSQNDKINFYRRQVAVGLLFKHIMTGAADQLSQLVQATRADTPNGAIGPTIADTIIKLEKVGDLNKSLLSEKSSLSIVDGSPIRENITYNGNIDELREDLLARPLPFLQAFYTLGIEEPTRMLGRYFPYFRDIFREVLEGRYTYGSNGEIVCIFKGLREMTKTGRLDAKTINSIYNDLLAYIMSGIEFFGSSKNKDGKEISAFEKRRDFINNFPTYFKNIVDSNKDIADIEFIKRLKPIFRNDKNPVNVVAFKNVGQLSSTLKERYQRDWATLLYMDNPKAQELALNLFLYSYYRNGFAFGPSTFIHLAPVAVRYAIPGYIETLRKLISSEDDFRNFIEQYIYNHLDNRRLVPEVPSTSSIEFVEEDGTIKDEITITISESSSLDDKTVVKSQIKVDKDLTVYEFFNFIARRVKNKYVYYKVTELKEEHTAVYTRIEPLGYKNSFLEYEYGVEASEMETVIDKNKKDYEPNSNYLS